MQRDRKSVIVDAPQLLENPLGLAAGVDEHQRGLVPLDQVVDLRIGVPRRMPGPGNVGVRIACIRFQHGDVRRGAGLCDHEIGKVFAVARLRHQIAPQIVRLGDRGGQADGVQAGREAKQPRQPERQQIAALRGHQRMQFVEDHALQRAEQIRRIGGRQQQRELFRRGEQDVRRIAALTRALRHRRVAGAGLDPDRQTHFGDRRFEIARDVDRERLQRRDVERVQAAERAGCFGRWRRVWPAPRRHAVPHSTPPASAESPRASCRRRSARSAAPIVRRAPASATQADAHAAPSRARQTSAQRRPAMREAGRWDRARSRGPAYRCDNGEDAARSAITSNPGTGTSASMRVETGAERANRQPGLLRAQSGHAPRHGRSAASARGSRRPRHGFRR